MCMHGFGWIEILEIRAVMVEVMVNFFFRCGKHFIDEVPDFGLEKIVCKIFNG